MENRTMQSSTLEPTGNGHELRSRRIADVVICLARSELGLGVYHTLTSLIGNTRRRRNIGRTGRVRAADCPAFGATIDYRCSRHRLMQRNSRANG